MVAKLPARQIHSMQSYEAEAQLLYNESKYQESFEAMKKWLRYQPFSSRPALQGSFIASLALEDFEEAVNIARIGLLSSPHEFMLQNNLAFSLLSQNKIDEAEQIFNRVNASLLSKEEMAVYNATKGALAFRKGFLDEGRTLYKNAIRQFEEEKNIGSKIMAMYFWYREENLSKGTEAPILRGEIENLLEKYPLKEIQQKFKK